MTLVKDESTVKIHTDSNGIVWYSSGVDAPQNSGVTCDAFLRLSVVNSLSAQVRLLGVPSNAALIVELYQRRQRKEIADIQVAGPSACPIPDDMTNPAHTLLRMRAINASPSCGGWHTVAPIEYAVYVLLHRLQNPELRLDPLSHTYFKLNPLCKVFHFVPFVNDLACASLLTTIIDPRWYVDARMPDRSSKLELFLGLTPKTQRRVSDTQTIVTKKRDLRCATVLQCWQTRTADEIDFDDPHEFLWRIWKTAGADANGDLRASQAFIRFVRLNWLDMLDTRRGRKDGIFNSKHFFKTDAEHKAFLKYMKKE